MNGKDTMMTPEELVPYLSTTDLFSAMCVDYEKAFKAQAEVSFRAGIGEVVEWIEEHHRRTYEHGEGEVTFNHVDWHAKLWEWGL